MILSRASSPPLVGDSFLLSSPLPLSLSLVTIDCFYSLNSTHGIKSTMSKRVNEIERMREKQHKQQCSCPLSVREQLLSLVSFVRYFFFSLLLVDGESFHCSFTRHRTMDKDGDRDSRLLAVPPVASSQAIQSRDNVTRQTRETTRKVTSCYCFQ